MLRSAAGKVMWMGRATVFTVGLAVILALVFGVVSRATAHDGFAGLFHLGHNNPVSALSTLAKSGAGPALSLKVDSGPPLAVNSGEKVAKLNADRLDGKDSSALGVTTKTQAGYTHICATAVGQWNECLPITVKVPAGKRYNVSWRSTFAATSSSNTTLDYCTGWTLPSHPQPICHGGTDTISLAQNYSESAAKDDQINGLGPGTYTFSTLIKPQAALAADDQNVTTTVLVTDASVPGPPID